MDLLGYDVSVNHADISTIIVVIVSVMYIFCCLHEAVIFVCVCMCVS